MQRLSNLITAIALFGSCSIATDQIVAAPRADRRADDTAFYQVPLMCPAARGLGCGSRAKPVLLALEKTPSVEEAWLDHAGQMLAVIWTRGSAPADRAATLAAISEAHAVSMEELSAAARDAAWQSFRAGEGWHRGAEVDHLSEQEAQVIADRLLVRLVTRVPSARDKVESLRPVITETTRRMLLGLEPSGSEYREKLLAAAREDLTGQEVNALGEAVELGLRPVGDER